MLDGCESHGRQCPGGSLRPTRFSAVEVVDAQPPRSHTPRAASVASRIKLQSPIPRRIAALLVARLHRQADAGGQPPRSRTLSSKGSKGQAIGKTPAHYVVMVIALRGPSARRHLGAEPEESPPCRMASPYAHDRRPYSFRPRAPAGWRPRGRAHGNPGPA